VSFNAPWWRNGSFWRPQSLQFLNRSLYRSSPAVINVRRRLKKYCQKNKRQRRDTCEEFWCDTVTKTTGLKSVTPGTSRHFSESREYSYVSSAMCPKCPRRGWRTKSFGLQSTPGVAIIFAWGPLWEGRIFRRAVRFYGSRSRSWCIASALIFPLRSWTKFQVGRIFWMLLRATENAMAGHIWPTVRYLPTLVYTHWKAAQRSSKDQVAWLHIRPCLVPSWCGANRTVWDCCWPWGISFLPRAAAPSILPKRKAGTEMSEWMNTKA